MNLHITPSYAAVLALFYFLLSIGVIRSRRYYKVSLGAGGGGELERRIREHGNFAEYAPFTLLLLALAELQGAPAAVLHLLGLCLVAGRLFHAWGLSRLADVNGFRVGGMALTFAAMTGAAVLMLTERPAA
jgi:uncharacterized membrane protein YecN with MAPEG domain